MVVKTQTISMIIDPRLILRSSFHALTKADVGNRQDKKCDGHHDPENVGHDSGLLANVKFILKTKSIDPSPRSG
jgi:hypothetical protein